MKSNSKTQKLNVLWNDRAWSAAISARTTVSEQPADRVAIYSTDDAPPKGDTQLIVRNRLVKPNQPYHLRKTWNN